MSNYFYCRIRPEGLFYDDYRDLLAIAKFSVDGSYGRVVYAGDRGGYAYVLGENTFTFWCGAVQCWLTSFVKPFTRTISLLTGLFWGNGVLYKLQNWARK